MKNINTPIFKIGNSLEQDFKRYIRENKSSSHTFVFVQKQEVELKKAYKLIASLIEDDWATKDVTQKENYIEVSVKKRKKTKFVYPKNDTHFNKNKDRYQYHTLLGALSFVKEKRTAIDIGGHIGLYSSALLDTFQNVHGFEPSPINSKCFVQNVPTAILHTCGLGDKEYVATLNMADDNTGNNSIVESFGQGKVNIQVKTLDSFDFIDVDLIKIDVQGFEEQVLLGAEKTLKDNDPVLIVELITHKDSPPNESALSILVKYGYNVRLIIGKDYILSKD